MRRRVYADVRQLRPARFKWLRPGCSRTSLRDDLRADAQALLGVLEDVSARGTPERDAKLDALVDLLDSDTRTRRCWSSRQFADTVRLPRARSCRHAGVASDGRRRPATRRTRPTLAWRFSPVSNDKRDRVTPATSCASLVATDVLSEGQNLQDCAIVVNFDLPWAIIRLIQRAGRVDRIGQQAERSSATRSCRPMASSGSSACAAASASG